MSDASIPAILFACAMLAIGLVLRANVSILKRLFIPASVVAGAVGFALVQVALRVSPGNAWTASVLSVLSGWPGTLIAIVFAGLLLEKPSDKTFGEALRRGVRSAVLAWIIILGQIVIGLLVYIALVRPSRGGVPASFGQLLEVSWAGGHGSSAAMGQVYAALGFPEGRDIAFFLATVGLIWGVVSGLALVNLAIRRGWTSRLGDVAGVQPVSGLEPASRQHPIGFAKTRSEVMDPLVLQIVILAAAVGVGLGLRRGFMWIAGAAAAGDEQTLRFISNVPLFLFTLLGGWIVRQAMRAVHIERLIDSGSMQRLIGVAMEFLIVSAITTLRIEALQSFFVPIIALLVLARRLLPRGYWFELGLLNYGFSTANTPQGLMLLRIVDPDLKSGAAEDYAVAAPLSAPFIGGGVLTIVALPLLLQRVPAWSVMSVLMFLVVALYALGRAIARRGDGDDQAFC